MIHQALALPPRNHTRDVLLALANRVLLAYERETIPQEQAGEEGAKRTLHHPFTRRTTSSRGKSLLEIDADVGKVFVVLE